MNPAHLHLMLTHLPVVGTLFAILLLALSLLKKSDALKQAALGALVLVGLLAIPVFLTGEPSEDIVERLPGVSEPLLEQHEEAGEISLIMALAVGAVSLLGFFFRRGVPQGFAAFVLVVALISQGSLIWTSRLGGKMRHSELRNGPEAARHHHED